MPETIGHLTVLEELPGNKAKVRCACGAVYVAKTYWKWKSFKGTPRCLKCALQATAEKRNAWAFPKRKAKA